jgi:hypothetical protein
MRQIGARQEAAKVGGIGSCGRELCCSTWLTDFKSVNTTAARYQNLSINQSKLSGQCGRLKCCLNYELDTYLDALQSFPDNAEILQVAKGNATLIKKDIFKSLMWYVLPDSNKQYPVTIERVRKIKQLNAQGTIPEQLEAVDITSKTKEEEPEFVDLVGQISLRTLERAEKKKRHQQHQQKDGGNRPQQPRQPQRPQNQQGGNQQGGNQQGGQQQGGQQQGGNQQSGQQQGGQQNKQQGGNQRNQQRRDNRQQPKKDDRRPPIPPQKKD